tara:strand:- start:686 stop:1369 length:684 start_codon:yes stop_codon:yes gene_type:complete
MIDNWTPEQQDIDWTQEHFNSMAVGDTWSVSGALIEKISDTELSLRQYPAEAALAAERVAKVCGEMGVVFNTEDAELIDDPMASAAAAASGWVCPESNIHLCNFDLQDAEWSVSAVPTQTNTGEAEITDQWTVRITHPNDDGDAHEVFMTPMDYHLIAGDDLFFSWQGFRVIEREEAVRYADDRESFLACLDNLSIALLGSTYNESPVPPHMRGMLVTKLTALGEEE